MTLRIGAVALVAAACCSEGRSLAQDDRGPSPPATGSSSGPAPHDGPVDAEIEIPAAAPRPRQAPAPPSPEQSAGRPGAVAAPAPAKAEPRSILGLPIHTTTNRPDSGSAPSATGGVTLTGYAQLQYITSELSEDQVRQSGAPQNRDQFQLRLARLRLDGGWGWAGVALEVSANTVAGPYIGLVRAEALLVWRNPAEGAPPYLVLTGGLQEIAFGRELPESTRRRLFFERSAGSQALFPGTTDLGLRLSGGVAFLRYAVAVMNGVPFVDRAGASYEVNTRAKDVLGRLGFEAGGRAGSWQLAGGASFAAGTGFLRGRPATPAGVQWRDTNENGVIDPGELVGVPAQAATPSETFSRWAAALDLELRVRTWLGVTTLAGEAVVASNLDRGLFVSDPLAQGHDVRQLAGYALVTQEVRGYGLVGFRWDYYNGNADALDSRRGVAERSSQELHTLSPLVGVQAFDHLRLLAQYDVVIDHLGRDARGVPIDLPNNQLSVRLQGEF